MTPRLARTLMVVCAVGACSAGMVSAESVQSLVKEGNRLYEEGRFAEALERYERAETLEPGLPALHYNMGNAYYRQGDFEKAYEHYRRAFAANEDALAEGARFNAGNAHFARESWKEAITNYKEALRLDPEDRDAKRNLELALQRLRAEQQRPPQQQQEQQQPPRDEQQSQPEPRPAPGEGSAEDGQAPPDAGPPPAGGGKPSKDEISREEAMRILEAMKDRDKPPKDRLKVPPPDRRPERDW